MNYIRTKDGRIIDTTKIATGSKYMDFATNDESFKEIFKTESLLKADTIEELCDVFVIDWLPTNHKDIFAIDEYSKKVVEGCIGNNKTKVYGAIWTDKGLIYVAKMNDEGELELI